MMNKEAKLILKVSKNKNYLKLVKDMITYYQNNKLIKELFITTKKNKLNYKCNKK